jgi:hypothetical protein
MCFNDLSAARARIERHCRARGTLGASGGAGVAIFPSQAYADSGSCQSRNPELANFTLTFMLKEGSPIDASPCTRRKSRTPP